MPVLFRPSERKAHVLTYAEIPHYQQRRAKQLANELIGQVNIRLIGDDDDAFHKELRNYVRMGGAELRRDFWYGAWDGKTMVGMIHSGPPYESLDVARAGLRGDPRAGSGQWFLQYVSECEVINEIAVRPNYQRQGIAMILIQAVIDESRRRGVINLSSAATTAGAASLFSACGWDVQPAGEPLDPSRANNLKTVTHPTMRHIRWASLKL